MAFHYIERESREQPAAAAHDGGAGKGRGVARGHSVARGCGAAKRHSVGREHDAVKQHGAARGSGGNGATPWVHELREEQSKHEYCIIVHNHNYYN